MDIRTQKVFIRVIIFLLFSQNLLNADLPDQLHTLQQSLTQLKKKLSSLSTSLELLGYNLTELVPRQTFEEIKTNVTNNHSLNLTLDMGWLSNDNKNVLQAKNISFYDVSVLPQEFKKGSSAQELASLGIWLSSIDPQFARDGWLCGFHSIKNALYLCKLLTVKPTTIPSEKQEKLIQNFQGAGAFLKYLEWPKTLKAQPKLNIPLDAVNIGRDAVIQHLQQEKPWTLVQGPLPWGMSWLKRRMLLDKLEEAPTTLQDTAIQYKPELKPAIYSIMYNPIDLPEDLIDLKESMSIGNTAANKFMKRCLQKIVIIRKFYPEDVTQEKFLPEDKTALKMLGEKFRTQDNFITPILWSYKISQPGLDLGNHWVTLVVVKKNDVKEILLADPNIPHWWREQNNRILEELLKVLTDPNHFD